MDWVAIALVICSTTLAGCGWGLICNRQTYRERVELIANIGAQRSAAATWEAFRKLDAVSYEQHMWRRFFFLNPWSAYDPSLQKLAGATK